MCDPQTLSLIEEVVDRKVNNQEMFTAFDVSLEVQEKAKGQGLPFTKHSHMKGDTHRCIDTHVNSGAYQRTLKDVGAPVDAFLYYPAGADPDTYVPRPRKDAVKTAPAAVAATSPGAIDTSQFGTSDNNDDSDVSSAVDTDDDEEGDQTASGRTPDARGSLTVPSYLLRAAGFAEKEVAYVTKQGDTLVLSKQTPPGSVPLTTYTVDYHNNVRITDKTLANIPGSSYDFDGTSDQVVVSGH